jgi:hypothetical protein
MQSIFRRPMATTNPAPSLPTPPNKFSAWIQWGNSIAGYGAVIAVVVAFFFVQKAIQNNETRIAELDKKADALNAKISLFGPRLTEVSDSVDKKADSLTTKIASIDDKVKGLSSSVDQKAADLNSKIASIDDKVKKLTSLGKYLDDKQFLDKVLNVFAEIDKKDAGKLVALVHELEPKVAALVRQVETKLSKDATYEIVNVQNSKLLDMSLVKGDPDGAQVYIWTKNGQANQRWKLVKVE